MLGVRNDSVGTPEPVTDAPNLLAIRQAHEVIEKSITVAHATIRLR